METVPQSSAILKNCCAESICDKKIIRHENPVGLRSGRINYETPVPVELDKKNTAIKNVVQCDPFKKNSIFNLIFS